MEIYERVLVRSNIARHQERNNNYAPELVHIYFHVQPITFLLHMCYYKKLNNIYSAHQKSGDNLSISYYLSLQHHVLSNLITFVHVQTFNFTEYSIFRNNYFN